MPAWAARHSLTVGEFYFTNDSDLALEYLGLAQVRDPHGYRLVMVFREVGREQVLLTLGEADAEESRGFTPLADHIERGLRRET